MNPEDRLDFAKMLHAASGLYNVRLEPPQIEMWWSLCKGITISTFLRAMDQVLKENPRWPRPAEVLKAARSGRVRRAEPLALEAPRADPDHAKESFALIREITKTRMKPAERLKRFEAMAAKWPGKGWEDAVDQTRELVRARGGR